MLFKKKLVQLLYTLLYIQVVVIGFIPVKVARPDIKMQPSPRLGWPQSHLFPAHTILRMGLYFALCLVQVWIQADSWATLVQKKVYLAFLLLHHLVFFIINLATVLCAEIHPVRSEITYSTPWFRMMSSLLGFPVFSGPIQHAPSPFRIQETVQCLTSIKIAAATQAK